MDPVALRAEKRRQAREQREYRIRQKQRQTLDTGFVETTQELKPFTGQDHSAESMSTAVDFWLNHTMPSWMERGRCKDMDQSIFYGDEDRSGKARHHPNLTVDEVARARRICNACPVQMQCLDHAIRNREEFGIWGGSTAGQRRNWIKQFEQQNYAVLDEEEIDLTSYDEVFGGYEDSVDDLVAM